MDLDESEVKKIRILFNDPIHKDEITGNQETITQELDPMPRSMGAVLVIIAMLQYPPPPEKQKISPCALTETWVDPSRMEYKKAQDTIKENLKRQFSELLSASKKGTRSYEKDRGPIRVEMDCSPSKVYGHCDSVRKSINNNRMIFYYNGHGTLSCTHETAANNQGIWVLNSQVKHYTVLPLGSLMEKVQTPALYIWDCDNAGHIVNTFNTVARDKKRTWVESRERYFSEPMFEEKSLHLAACGADETLPQNPELPADLYTCCLTTALKAALRFWFHQQKVTGVQILDCLEYLDAIPGSLNTKGTMLGELEWILVAVHDTLAWQMELGQKMFIKLFRNCRLVAGCFRGHILADRIMRFYNVRPISKPELPSMARHPLWKSWDLALDSIMSELSFRKIRMSRPAPHRQISTFFCDQLTEFKVYLSQHQRNEKIDCRQLPVLFHMLMGSQYREECLRLIGKFLDRGPYAVHKFLDLGFLPYLRQMLKLPSSNFKYIMVLIWAKILATDRRVTTIDPILADNSCRKFFVDILNDSEMMLQTRAMACFCLSILVRFSQKNMSSKLLGDNLVKELNVCLEDMSAPNTPKSIKLQNCAVLCLAYLWDGNEKAMWTAVRANTIENYVVKLLDHSNPETRTAAVYALGTFLNTRRSDSQHGESIEHKIAKDLLLASRDGSVHVRREAVVALSRYIQQYEQKFITVAISVAEDLATRIQKTSICEDDESSCSPSLNSMRKISSNKSLLSPQSRIMGNKFVDTWRTVKGLERDPDGGVRRLVAEVVKFIEKKMPRIARRKTSETSVNTDSSPESYLSASINQPYAHFNPKRDVFGEGRTEKDDDERPPSISDHPSSQIIRTQFADWTDASFSKPLLAKRDEESDPNSEAFALNLLRDMKYTEKKSKARAYLEKRAHEKLDAQIYGIKHHSRPHKVNFHPFEPLIYILDDHYCSLVEYDSKPRLHHRFECCEMRGVAKDAILLNHHKRPFLCVINNEAEVYVWRSFENPEFCTLASTFKAYSELNKRVRMLMNYAEFSSNLLISGQVKRIVSWNLVRETRYQDIQTQSEMPLTSFASFDRPSGPEQESLLLAGFYDGICRLYDLREPSHNQVVQKFGDVARSKVSPVVSVHIKPNNDNKIIYTASNSGEMCFWDLRKTKTEVVAEFMRGPRYQSQHHNTLDVVSSNLRTVAFHNYAPVMACGSYDQGIRIWNTWGDKLNDIKFHEGFMGQKVGPSVSLEFHPFEYKLVSAGQDNCVTVYGKATDPVNKM